MEYSCFNCTVIEWSQYSVIPNGHEGIPSSHNSTKIGYKIHIQNSLMFVCKVFRP